MYAAGTFTPLTAPAGGELRPYGINGLGQVVGEVAGGGLNGRGFLYAGGTLTPIDVPGAQSTRAQGISDAGRGRRLSPHGL